MSEMFYTKSILISDRNKSIEPISIETKTKFQKKKQCVTQTSLSKYQQITKQN